LLPEDELVFALEDVETVDRIVTIVSLDESLVKVGRDDIEPTSSPRRFEENVHVLLIIYLSQDGNVTERRYVPFVHQLSEVQTLPLGLRL
jgi:hypothetical protein